MSLYKSTMNTITDDNEDHLLLLKKYIESFKNIVDKFHASASLKYLEKLHKSFWIPVSFF